MLQMIGHYELALPRYYIILFLMDPFYYYTIEQPAIAEFKDRGSKFFAYSFPVVSIDDCKKKVSAAEKGKS